MFIIVFPFICFRHVGAGLHASSHSRPGVVCLVILSVERDILCCMSYPQPSTIPECSTSPVDVALAETPCFNCYVLTRYVAFKEKIFGQELAGPEPVGL